jgi:hypothetical protein
MQANGDPWNRTFYDRAIQTKIGQGLRAQYDFEQPLPERLFALLMELDEPKNAGRVAGTSENQSGDQGPDGRQKVGMNELPSETQEQLFRALGQAVVGLWGDLPHDIQHHLFEAVATSQGESVRQRLAVFLHDKHPRTTDSMKARAMPEPDSLGG